MVANFDLSHENPWYAQAACEIATSIIFSPCFCLLRKIQIVACFPSTPGTVHLLDTGSPCLDFRLCLKQCHTIAFAAVRVFISGVAGHRGTFLHNFLKCLPCLHCTYPCAHTWTSLVSQGFCMLAGVVAGGVAGGVAALAADPAAARGERGLRCRRNCSGVERAGGCCSYSLRLLSLKLAHDFPTGP